MIKAEIKKQKKITLNKLALMMGRGFNEVYKKIEDTEKRLRIDIEDTEKRLRTDIEDTEKRLRTDFITTTEKIAGELQKMREEHAASFMIYRELEQRLFNLEQKVKIIESKIKA